MAYINNILTLNGWTILVCKKIAKKIDDREAAIAIEIADLYSDDDRDLNFGDRANALQILMQRMAVRWRQRENYPAKYSLLYRQRQAKVK